MTPTHLPAADGWNAVVLAAGRGTRMRSRTPKVLHALAGRAMLDLVCDALSEAGAARLIAVVGSADDEVARHAGERATLAVQAQPRGTGDAAHSAREAVGEAGTVLIVHGDLPLLTSTSLRALVAAHIAGDGVLTFATVEVEDPSGFGRVVREGAAVSAIVEEAEADARTRAIHEVNVGVYVARGDWLWPALERLTPSASGEVYLPAIVGAAIAAGEPVRAHCLDDPSEAWQVNTRAELARAEGVLRERVRARLMAQGVTLVDPASSYVDATVEVGEDTTLLPGTHLLGATTIGRDCRIGPSAVLRDMRIGDGCTIEGSTLEGSTLGDEVEVGPYCHVRPGSTIERGAHLGNYAEVKASRIGERSKMGHFSYVGDSDVGVDVNIGAGAVTVNYDGEAKHRTEIGDGAFIGSDTMLVAPVRVGAGGRTAAGAVVTKDVPPGAMVIGAPARVRDAAGGEER